MTPQKQLYLHKPAEGISGDCYRTAIACLLDRAPAEVPHFYDHNVAPGDGEQHRDAWLAEQGWFRVAIAFNSDLVSLLRMMEALNPGTYYILSGFSRTGVNHSVIGCGGEIVHDPSLTDAGIVGPCDDGFYWIELLLPIAMKAAA